MCGWGRIALLIVATLTKLPAADTPAVAPFNDAQTSTDLIKSGESKYRNKDFTGALMDYEMAVRFSPDDAAIHLNKALEQQARGDVAGANLELWEAYTRYPMLPYIFGKSGEARHAAGDFYGAIADFTIALNLNPRAGEIYGARGDSQLALGECAAAIADFNRAIPVIRMPSYVYYRRGVATGLLGNTRQAIIDFSKSIEDQPTLTSAYRARAFAYCLLDDWDHAHADLSHLMEIAPKNAGAFRDRSWVYLLQGDYARALKEVTKADELQPQILWIIRNKAIVYDLLDDSESAQSALNAALQAAESNSNPSNRIYLHLQLSVLRKRLLGVKIQSDTYYDDLMQWPDRWPKRIALYLTEHITAESLIKASSQELNTERRQQKKCEAYYYAGMMALFADKRDDARVYLRQCLETKRNELTEYVLAKEQLRHLTDTHP